MQHITYSPLLPQRVHEEAREFQKPQMKQQCFVVTSEVPSVSDTQTPKEHSETKKSQKPTHVMGSQFISEGEILSSISDCPCLISLLRGFNSAYRCGFLFAYFALVIATFITVPFCGMFIGVLEFVCQGLRLLLRPIGKIIADLFGYGGLVSSQIIRNERELELLKDV